MKLTLSLMGTHDLVPYEANSKNHGDEDVKAIGQSITRFGFNDPIAITPEGVIVEGHGRWLAAQALGLDQVPVIVLEDMSEADHDLYRIAHNKISLSSQFNFADLFDQLQTLVGDANNITFGDMGFSDKIIDNLFVHFGSPDERASSESQAADGAPLAYDVVWDTKEDKAKFSRFITKEVEAGADKAASGEIVMAVIRRLAPEIYAELERAVPGEVAFDEIAGHTEEEAHVRV